MPPWLEALLSKNKAIGLVDSLALLTGSQPEYVKLPELQQRSIQGKVAQVAGRMDVRDDGTPVIGLTPFTLSNFASTQQAGYQTPGYKPIPALLGDAVIQHEFGHIAANGLMGDQLEQIERDPELRADYFQNAVQFLRNGQVATDRLDKKTSATVDLILKHPLYKDHPINKARGVQGFLKGVMKQ